MSSILAIGHSQLKYVHKFVHEFGTGVTTFPYSGCCIQDIPEEALYATEFHSVVCLLLGANNLSSERPFESAVHYRRLLLNILERSRCEVIVLGVLPRNINLFLSYTAQSISQERLDFLNGRAQKTLLDHMEISVTESEKRANSALNIRDYYTVYLIETKPLNGDWEAPTNSLGMLWRRYTEFEQLRAYLEVTYVWAIIPPLPEKRPTYTWHNSPSDTFDPDFIDRRRVGLENFLHRVAAHPVLCRDLLFLAFLQQEEGWRESMKETGYIHLAENKLRALSIGGRLKTVDPRFEEVKNYANGLQNNLHNLLRTRAKLAARLNSIHKMHAGYGRIFSEWSVIEKEMGDGLQKSGHFFDSIAAGVSTALEDEELIADQLKEYLFFANAIQAVCKRQEILQYELDQAQDSVKNKSADKVKVQQGRSGLMSRLFGSVETEEMRDYKLSQLETKIQAGEATVRDCKVALNDFSEKALEEFDDFQEKKVADLKDTLGSYLQLQIKIARKGLQTWTHIRDCIDSIP